MRNQRLVRLIACLSLSLGFGCGGGAKPRGPKPTASPRTSAPVGQGERPASVVPDAKIKQLDAAFNEHVSALKNVHAVMEPIVTAPSGGELPIEPIRAAVTKAVESQKRLMTLGPGPPPPGLRHTPTPQEAVAGKYGNEIRQLTGQIKFNLKICGELSPPQREAFQALAAQFGPQPGEPPPPGK
jgi:hypothetical protein